MSVVRNRKSILRLTGMRSTKYGAIEEYLIHFVERANGLGFHVVLQYEETPWSEAYIRDLSRHDMDLVCLKTKEAGFRGLVSLARLVREVRPEILHLDFTPKEYLYVIPFVSRFSGVRRVVRTCHNPPYSENDSWIRCYLRALAFNRCDILHAYSGSVRDALMRTGARPESVRLVHLGLFGGREKSESIRDQLRQQLNLNDDTVVFGCIAFDAEFKGVDVLLNAFQIVTRDCPDVHLVSIGIDPENSRLPKLAEELKVSDRVSWMGIVDNGWKLLSAVDIYVQPSREEAFALAALEAMAMQLPVVLTKGVGLSQYLEDGVSCVKAEANDPRSLAEAMMRMIHLQPEWGRFGLSGYDVYRRRFRGEDNVERLFREVYGLDG